MPLTSGIAEKLDAPATAVGERLARRAGVTRHPSPNIELFVLPGFLTPKDCKRIVEVMDDAWEPSTIADDIGVANYRTSETSSMDPTHSLIASLEERIIELTGLDPLHGEPLQAQRYKAGQEFKEHTDYFEPDGPDFERFCAEAGQRTWTVMIYLNEPEAGGFTYFKEVGAAVKPVAGTLVAWNNLTPDGRPNYNTLHHGMPVEKGGKYIVTKWFRQKSWPWPEPIAQRLSEGLRFDGRPSHIVPSAPTANLGAVPAATASATAVAESTALRRREWILSVRQEMQNLTDAPGEIRRVRGLSSEEFLEKYYAAGRPVIIEQEMEDWPAITRWNPDYLKRRIGSAPVEFQARRNANAEFELEKDVHKTVLPFDEYMNLIAGTSGNDAYITAYNSGPNQASFEALAPDVRPLSKFLSGKLGMLWIGPMGTYTPLHHDLTNNLLAQVVGSKHLVMVPPSETRHLYNHRHVFSAVHDIMDEERLTHYPLARNAITYEIDLAAGELLFIPIGWWHQVTALDFSMTYTFTDFHWPNAFHENFPGD